MIHLGVVFVAVATLVGETSHPKDSFFAIGSEAKITLCATGFVPRIGRPLLVRILDHQENEVQLKDVAEKFVPDENGRWTGTFSLPTARLGCFKVFVSSGDVELPKMGTRGKGYLTYAVVPDPDKRPLIPQENAFFGCYGDPRWLGCRQHFNSFVQPTNVTWKSWGHVFAYHLLTAEDSPWSWGWKYYDEAGRDWIRRQKGANLQALVLSTEEGERHYRRALANLVKETRANTPAGQKWRIYEPHSEVDLNIPKPEDAVKLARILREVLDENDPEGLTGYPGMSTITATGYHKLLFDLGLAKYLNAFTLHAYTPFPPEPNGFVRNLRSIKRLLKEYGLGAVPMFGTEAGYSSRNDKQGELMKLNGQLRSNLIMMGEGFKFNYAFYGQDFGNDDDRCKDGDYGLRYNLLYGTDPKYRYSDLKTSPRAIAAAIAAASWILDGKRPTACIEGIFGETSLGYAFQEVSGDQCAIALWDYGGKGSEAKLPVGRDRIAVADVMGNETIAEAPEGILRLPLSESPVYVVGPDPELWGRGGTMAARLAKESARLAKEREAKIKLRIESVEPAFVGDIPAVRARIENRTDDNQLVVFETRLPGVPEARKRIRTSIGPHVTQSVTLALDGFAPTVTNICGMKFVAALADGFRAECEEEMNFWRAPHGMAENPVRHPVDPEGRIRFAFGWDENFLIGDVMVEDDCHVNAEHGWLSWRGDALQLGVAKTWLKHPTENNWTDMLTQAPSEYTVALTTTGAEVCRTQTFDYRIYPAGTDSSGLVSPEESPRSVVRENGKTHYRFGIPWKFLNFKEAPKPGTTIRIAAFVNDQDAAGGPLTIHRLFDLKQSVPRNFGRIVLAE